MLRNFANYISEVPLVFIALRGFYYVISKGFKMNMVHSKLNLLIITFILLSLILSPYAFTFLRQFPDWLYFLIVIIPVSWLGIKHPLGEQIGYGFYNPPPYENYKDILIWGEHRIIIILVYIILFDFIIKLFFN